MAPFLGVPNPGQELAREPDRVSLSQRNPPGSHPALFLGVYVCLHYLNTRNRAVPSHLPQRSPQDGLSARSRTDPDPIPAPPAPQAQAKGWGRARGSSVRWKHHFHVLNCKHLLRHRTPFHIAASKLNPP